MRQKSLDFLQTLMSLPKEEKENREMEEMEKEKGFCRNLKRNNAAIFSCSIFILLKIIKPLLRTTTFA